MVKAPARRARVPVGMILKAAACCHTTHQARVAHTRCSKRGAQRGVVSPADGGGVGVPATGSAATGAVTGVAGSAGSAATAAGAGVGVAAPELGALSPAPHALKALAKASSATMLVLCMALSPFNDELGGYHPRCARACFSSCDAALSGRRAFPHGHPAPGCRPPP